MADLESISVGYLDEAERKKVRSELYKTKFKSNLKVFQDHNGFIDGELHTFVGAKGAGKSTWSKTIISELLYDGKAVLLYISEERKNKYLQSVNENMMKILKDESKLEELMGNLVVISELDTKPQTDEEAFNLMEEIIVNAEIDIMIFDNFTTSFLSEMNISKQSRILRDFKGLADKLNIPVILFFHTAKLSDSSTLNGDNVRGSGTAINVGSYNYIIAQHKDGGTLRNFIYTEKARYHSRANKSMYEMFYNHDVGLFVDCKYFFMEDFKELIASKKKPRGGF